MSGQRAIDNFYYNQNRDANSYIQDIKNPTTATTSTSSSTTLPVLITNQTNNTNLLLSFSGSTGSTNTATSGGTTSSSSSAATSFIQNSAIQANTNRSIANQTNVGLLNSRIFKNEEDIRELKTTTTNLIAADIANKNALTTDINKVSNTLTTLSGDIYGKYTALTTSVNGHTSDISLINGKIVDICGAIQNIVVNGTGSSGGTTTIPSDISAAISTISGSLDNAWVNIRGISSEIATHLSAYNTLAGKYIDIETDIVRLEGNVSALSTINDISGTIKNLLSDVEILAKLDASATQFAGDIQGIKNTYDTATHNLGLRIDKVDVSINNITTTLIPGINATVSGNTSNISALTGTVSSNKTSIEGVVEDLSSALRTAVITYDLSGKISTNTRDISDVSKNTFEDISAVRNYAIDLSKNTFEDISSVRNYAIDLSKNVFEDISSVRNYVIDLSKNVFEDISSVRNYAIDLSKNTFEDISSVRNYAIDLSKNTFEDISAVRNYAIDVSKNTFEDISAVRNYAIDLSENVFEDISAVRNYAIDVSKNTFEDISAVRNYAIDLSKNTFEDISSVRNYAIDLSENVFEDISGMKKLIDTLTSNTAIFEDISAVRNYAIDVSKNTFEDISAVRNYAIDLSNNLDLFVSKNISGELLIARDISDVSGRVLENKSEINTLKDAVITNNLAGKISDNARDISDVSGLVATNTASISGLTTKFTTLSGSVDSIKSNLTVFDENVDAIKQASSLSDKLDIAVRDISDVSGRMLTLSGEISTLSGRITTEETATTTLSNRIDYHDAYNLLLQDSLGDPIDLEIVIDANYNVESYTIAGGSQINYGSQTSASITFNPPFKINNEYVYNISGVEFSSLTETIIDLKKPFTIFKTVDGTNKLKISFYKVNSSDSQSARLPASITKNLQFYKQKLEIIEDNTNKIKTIKIDDDMATITSSKNPENNNQRYLEYMADASSPVPAHVFIGDISMNGALAVGGATNLKNNLDVSGTSTLRGATNLNGGLTIAGGDVSLNGLSGLTVGGATNLNGGLNVTSGSVSLTGTTGLEVAGATTLKNGATVEGAVTYAKNGLTVDGATTLNNGLTVAGASSLGGETTLGGKTIFNADASMNNALTVAGATTLKNGATVEGAVTHAKNGLTVDGATTLNNGLTVAGASSLGGETTFGNKTIFNADASMNNALTVAGATTLKNGLNVTSGSVSLTGTTASGLTVTGATTLNNALTVAGATTLNNGLNVTSGSVSLTGTTASGLTVTGATTLNNALTVAGATTLNDQLILKTSTASKPLLINTADPFDGNTAQVLGATPWYGRTASPAFLIDGVKGNYTFTDLNFKLAPKSAVYPGEVATTRYKIEADGAHTWYDNNGTSEVLKYDNTTFHIKSNRSGATTNDIDVLGLSPYISSSFPLFVISGNDSYGTFETLKFKLSPKWGSGNVVQNPTTRYAIEADGNHNWYGKSNNDVLKLYTNTKPTNSQYGDLVIKQTGNANNMSAGGLSLYNHLVYPPSYWTMNVNNNKDLIFYFGENQINWLLHNPNTSGTLNFTGFHRSVLENKTDETNHKKYTGLIVEASGKLNNIFYDKNIENDRYKPNETEALPTVRLTTTRASKRVFGVVSTKEELRSSKRVYSPGGSFATPFDIDTSDELEMTQRYNIASVGEGMVYMVLRDEDRKPENGDLIISSDLIAGYGELQDDDLVRNITVGKLTCDWDYEYLEEKIIDGYKCKLMSCVYYCG